MEAKDDYVKKCMKCKHSYTKQNESDTLFCSLKKCRYEEFNLTGRKNFDKYDDAKQCAERIKDDFYLNIQGNRDWDG